MVALKPPSTTICCPVTYDAEFDARKVPAPARSCGFPLSTRWYFVIYACNPSRPGQNDKVKDGAIQNLGGKLVVLAPAAASNARPAWPLRERSL